jgi:hypothetical protein
MKQGAMRRAAAVGALCAAALLGGCNDNSGPQDLTGTWEGTLNLTLADGNALAGGLTLVLDQRSSFASGGAEWAPVGETQSISGPVDGISVTLRLVFRCDESFETTVLEGTVDGDTVRIEDASGRACTLGGLPMDVADGSATLTRSSDGQPL